MWSMFHSSTGLNICLGLYGSCEVSSCPFPFPPSPCLYKLGYWVRWTWWANARNKAIAQKNVCMCILCSIVCHFGLISISRNIKRCSPVWLVTYQSLGCRTEVSIETPSHGEDSFCLSFSSSLEDEESEPHSVSSNENKWYVRLLVNDIYK